MLNNWSINRKVSSYGLFFILFFLIAGLEYGLVHQTSLQQTHDFFLYGVSIDLLIVIPVLYYFLVIRRTRQSPLFLLFSLSLSIFAAYLILPETHHFLIGYAEKMVILLEIALLGYLLFKLKKIIEAYQKRQIIEIDFPKNLKMAFQETVGNSPLIDILVHEIIMLRYGLFFWLKPQSPTGFSMHRESGFVALFVTLLMVSLIECVGVHLLLNRFASETTAWLFTGLSLYSLVFLLAHLFSVLDRKVVITEQTIQIRTGIIWDFEIPKNQIAELFFIKSDIDPKGKNILRLNKLLLTEANIGIRLTEKIKIKGIYGIRKEVDTIYLYLDEAAKFIAAVPI